MATTLRLRHVLHALAFTLIAMALPSSAMAGPNCPDPHISVMPGQTVTLTGYCSSSAPPITLTGVVAGPTHGVLSNLNPSGADYTPTAGYCGPDSLSYTATDGTPGTTTATISIEDLDSNGNTCAPPANRAPVCHGFAVSTTIDTDVLLRQTPPACSDPDGDAFGFELVPGTGPANGSALNGPDGPFYRPNPSYAGPDSFQFIARDTSGAASMAVTVTIIVSAPGGGAVVPPGGTFTSSDPSLPAVTITSPTGGAVGVVAVTPSQAPDPPSNYTLVGPQFEVIAPDAIAPNPIVLTFPLPADKDPSSVTIIRNGTQIDTPCDTSTTAASPQDPCFLPGPGNAITVRTSHASFWGLTLSPRLAFQQPIDGNTLNIAKLGRVVPVKLTLSANGVPITSGAVALSRIAGHSCDGSGSDVIETYAAAGSSNSGTAFRYDAVTGKWVYNLSTDTLGTTDCHRAYVTLNGSTVGHFDLRVTD